MNPNAAEFVPNSVACCQAEPAAAKPTAQKVTRNALKRLKKEDYRRRQSEKKQKEAVPKQAALQSTSATLTTMHSMTPNAAEASPKQWIESALQSSTQRTKGTEAALQSTGAES